MLTSFNKNDTSFILESKIHSKNQNEKNCSLKNNKTSNNNFYKSIKGHQRHQYINVETLYEKQNVHAIQ